MASEEDISIPSPSYSSWLGSWFGTSTALGGGSQHGSRTQMMGGGTKTEAKKYDEPSCFERMKRRKTVLIISCLLFVLVACVVTITIGLLLYPPSMGNRKNTTDRFYVESADLPTSTCPDFKSFAKDGELAMYTGTLLFAVNTPEESQLAEDHSMTDLDAEGNAVNITSPDSDPGAPAEDEDLERRYVPKLMPILQFGDEHILLLFPPGTPDYQEGLMEFANQRVTVTGIVANCSLFLDGVSDIGSANSNGYVSRNGTRPPRLNSTTLIPTSTSNTGAATTAPSRPTTTASPPRPTGYLGVTRPRKTVLIFFSFLDDPSQPVRPEEFRDRIFKDDTGKLNQQYSQVSWGQSAFVGMNGENVDVRPWVQIPYNKAGSCDYLNWAKAAHRLAGLSSSTYSLSTGSSTTSGYDHVIYIPNSATGCSWGGLAYIKSWWSMMKSVTISARTVAHELGHNLGMQHASTISCSVNGVSSFTGSASQCSMGREYADVYDTMGSSSPIYFYVNNRKVAGWDPPMAQITRSGTYTLAPITSSQRNTGTMGYYYRLLGTYTINSIGLTYMYFENRDCKIFARYHKDPGIGVPYSMLIGSFFQIGSGFTDNTNRIRVVVSSNQQCSSSSPNLNIQVEVW